MPSESLQQRFDRATAILAKLKVHPADVARDAGCSPSHLVHTINGDYAPSMKLVVLLEAVVERFLKRMVAIVLAARPSVRVLGFNLTSTQSPSAQGLLAAEEALRSYIVETLLSARPAGVLELPGGARGAIARLGGGLYVIYVAEDAGLDTGAIFDHEVAELRAHIVQDEPEPPAEFDVAF